MHTLYRTWYLGTNCMYYLLKNMIPMTLVVYLNRKDNRSYSKRKEAAKSCKDREHEVVTGWRLLSYHWLYE